MKRPLLFLLLILAFMALNANEPVPVYNSQFLVFNQKGLTLPNGEMVFFTSATNENDIDIVMTRVTVTGEDVISQSFNIANTAGEEYLVDLILSSDGCIIYTYNLLLPDTESYDYDLYIQKVSLTGQPLWGETGINVTRAYSDYKLTANMSGGAYLLRNCYLTGKNTLFGWNFDAQGNNLWQTETIYQMPSSYTLQLSDALCDQAGNIIVNMFESVSSDSYQYSHLVKFSPQGNVVGNDPLVSQNQFAGAYKLYGDPTGNYVLWKSALSSLSLQKMDASGNLLLPETVSYSLSENAISPHLGFCSDGSLYYCEMRNYPLFPLIYKLNPNLQPGWTAPVEIPFYWNYYLNTYGIATDNSLYLSYIDYLSYVDNVDNCATMLTCINSADGSFAFPVTCVSNQIFYKEADKILISADKALVLWYDFTDGDFGVKGQLVNPAGTVLLEPEGRTFQYKHSGSVLNYKVVDLPLGSCYVYELNNLYTRKKLYCQICDDNLSPLLGEEGIELNPDSNDAEWLKAIIKTPENQVGILYLSQNAQDVFSLYYQAIDNNGLCLLPGKGILLKETVTDQAYNYMMTCADGDILIAWEETYSLLYNKIIRGQRLHNNVPQWDAEGKILKQSTPYECGLVYLGTNYLVYEDYSYYYSYSWGIRKLDASGDPDPSWQLTDYITSGTHSDLMQSCSLAGDEMTVFYIKEFISGWYSRYDLYAQKYNSQGLPLWGNLGFRISSTQGSHPNVAGVYYGDKILFALSDFNNAELYFSITYNLINNNGTMNWQNIEPFSTEELYDAYNFKLETYNNDINSILWLSDRSDNDFKINHYYILSDGSLYYNTPVTLDQTAKRISNLQSVNKGSFSLATYCRNRYYMELKNYPEAKTNFTSGKTASSPFTGKPFGYSSEAEKNLSSAYIPKGININLTSLFTCKIPSEPVVTIDPLLTPETLSCCNYPNPFNPETTICFELSSANNVSLQIYNLKGQLIRTLLNDYLPAGKQSLVWKGTDNENNPVASGVYLYKIKAGKYSQTGKMMLMK
ncbi:MAG TPA: FlgD immunoglobulin-like domain containing protein [Candidatus Cloacimonas sp.]|nr:FlgD immunoglobulin-like domain containing protein [Candidatus Cloacimonas sp.]HPS59886.1 FlgD immunoglobulin-like domain containing protein [Candidatus Cloacimonas sp.]